MSTDNVVTMPFRLAFPEVFTAKAAIEGGKAKFGVTMLFAKDGTNLIPSLQGAGVLDLRRLAFAAAKEKWGEDKAKWPVGVRNLDFKSHVSPNGKDGFPIRDGDMVDWDGFKGTLFIRATSEFRPGVIDARKQEILAQSEVFGGLLARAQVNAFAYDTAGNAGVSFGLSNLQILKDDGTSFSGRQRAAEVFDAFGEAGPVGADTSSEAW
jgi:hypothetical protein